MTSFEKRLVALSMASHALTHFFEQVFPAILLLVEKDYHLGLAGVGRIANILPLFFGLGAIPAGFVVDRFGSRRTLLIFLLGVSLTGIGMLFVRPLWGVSILLAAMGLAAGLFHPAGLVLITQNMQKIGAGLGLQGVGGSFGLALGAIFAATVAKYLGWRWAYAALAVPGLILAAWFYGDKTLWKGTAHESESIREQPDKTSTISVNNYANATIPWLPLVLLFLLQILNGFCYRGILTFFPSFFSSAFQAGPGGGSVVAGGGLTTAILMVGVAGQYFGGVASDRWRGDWIYAICFTVATPILIIIGSLHGGVLIFSACVFAVLYFASQPAGNKILGDLTPPSFMGRAYGIFNFANFGIGSFSASICGWIGQKFGIGAIFPFLGIVLLGVSLMSWGMVVILSRKRPVAA